MAVLECDRTAGVRADVAVIADTAVFDGDSAVVGRPHVAAIDDMAAIDGDGAAAFRSDTVGIAFAAVIESAVLDGDGAATLRDDAAGVVDSDVCYRDDAAMDGLDRAVARIEHDGVGHRGDDGDRATVRFDRAEISDAAIVVIGIVDIDGERPAVDGLDHTVVVDAAGDGDRAGVGLDRTAAVIAHTAAVVGEVERSAGDGFLHAAIVRAAAVVRDGDRTAGAGRQYDAAAIVVDAVIDLQRAAVGGFQGAGIRHDVAGVNGQRAAVDIGVDVAVVVERKGRRARRPRIADVAGAGERRADVDIERAAGGAADDRRHAGIEHEGATALERHGAANRGRVLEI